MIHWDEIDEFNAGIRTCILINKNDLKQVIKDHRILELDNGVLVSQVGGHERRFSDFNQYVKDSNIQIALGLTLGYPPKCVAWFDLEEHDRNIKVYIGYIGSLHFVFPETLIEYVKEYFANEQLRIEWWQDYQYHGTGEYTGGY